jgi:nitrogen fixation-related uncharacterized protein
VVALLLPVALFLFLIGWSLYWAGKQTNAERLHRRRQNVSKEDVETGLIEELTEEQLTAE